MRAWERDVGAGESATAYEAFRTFRDLGPGRTLREAAAVYYGRPEYRSGAKRVPGRLKQWSARFDWVARAQALDDRDEMLRREAVEEHERGRARDLEERRLKLREQLLENGEKAARQEALMLDWPLVERLVQPNPDDPDQTETVILVPARWTKGTAKQMHDIASRAAGEPEKIAPTSPDGMREYTGQSDSIEEARAKIALMLTKIGVEPRTNDNESADGG